MELEILNLFGIVSVGASPSGNQCIIFYRQSAPLLNSEMFATGVLSEAAKIRSNLSREDPPSSVSTAGGC